MQTVKGGFGKENVIKMLVKYVYQLQLKVIRSLEDIYICSKESFACFGYGLD